ncbi:MAG: helix-turn-helix transcriptional regulator [Oceanicaulis sp.]
MSRAYGAVRRDVPHRLREIRHARGLTIEQLAELVGLTYQTVQRYETGDRSLRVEDLPRFAAVLKCRPGDLVDDDSADPDELVARDLFRKLSREDRKRLLAAMNAWAGDDAA